MTGSLAHHLAYFAHLAATGLGVIAIIWWTRDRVPPKWSSTVLGLGCLAMALAAFRASDPPNFFHDFWIAYYPAGQAVLQDAGRLHGLTAQGVDGFVNMPVVAYLFAPFAALPPQPAIALFTLIGLGFTGAAWFLLVRMARLGLTERWLLALLFVANGPLQYSVKEGNTSHIILFALAAGLALLRVGRSGAAGVVLGAAAIIKPPLLLFGFFFLLRRDLKGVFGFALAGAATTAASLALFGWAENLHWLQTCVLQFSHQWLAAFNVQSIPAFIFRLGGGQDRLLDWGAYTPSDSERLAGQLLTGLLYVIAAAAAFRRSGETPARAHSAEGLRLDLQYLLVLCLTVVSSPLSWSHYYAWLLMPVAFFLSSDWAAEAALTRRLGWVAIFLLTPLVWPLSLANEAAAAAYRLFGVSHLLLAGLLVFALVARRLARTGVLERAVRAGSTAALNATK